MNRARPSSFQRVADRRIGRRLCRAMRAGHLSLVFQPKADMQTGAVGGVEALVRWKDPRHGTLPPADWTHRIERGRVARRFNLWVLDHAMQQARAWQEAGIPLPVSMNLSPNALADRRLPEDVAKLIVKWNVDPKLLEIEVTELAVAAEGGEAAVADAMERLRNLGVKLAIDDFGVANSSLQRLVELPVEALKIDRSFIKRMGEGCERAETIVRAAIDLAHGLGITPVAEGIETEEVWDKLRRLGCTTAQGYLIDRPAEAREIELAVAPDGSITRRLERLVPERAEGRIAERRITTSRRALDRVPEILPAHELAAQLR